MGIKQINCVDAVLQFLARKSWPKWERSQLLLIYGACSWVQWTLWLAFECNNGKTKSKLLNYASLATEIAAPSRNFSLFFHFFFSTHARHNSGLHWIYPLRSALNWFEFSAAFSSLSLFFLVTNKCWWHAGLPPQSYQVSASHVGVLFLLNWQTASHGSYDYIVGVWAICVSACLHLRGCVGTCFPLCNFFANYFLNTQLGPNSICGFFDPNEMFPAECLFGMRNDDSRSYGGLTTNSNF